MTAPEPLHVQVARALGENLDHCWCGHRRDQHKGGTGVCARWSMYPAERLDLDECACEHFRNPVPRYDTDWSATGPLIEKYRMDLHYFATRGPDEGWSAGCMRLWKYGEECRDRDWTRSGPTPLVAVCRLLLALKEAGKL